MNPAFGILGHDRFRPGVAASATLGIPHAGTPWGEGPAWFADAQARPWSDIPNDR